MAGDEEKVLAAWLCAECYGKSIYPNWENGITSKLETQHAKTTTITLRIVEEDGETITLPQPLLSRNYNKTTRYFQEFFDPHGVSYQGFNPEYQAYFGGLDGGVTCWDGGADGNKRNTYEGSLEIDNAFTNSELYFADLRNNLVVMYSESGEYSHNANDTAPIGRHSAYADWGTAVGCKEINVLDAIRLPLQIAPDLTKKETITLGDYTPYTETAVIAGINKSVAASDHSGYCGGVLTGLCPAFPGYALIDTTKPYDCTNGTFTEWVLPEAIEDYVNTWDTNGSGVFKPIDDYDAAQFAAAFWDESLSRLKDGTYDYPNFVNVSNVPHGSWAVSSTGKTFYSQQNRNGAYFVKLDGQNPEQLVTEFKTDDKIFTTYFPVAPV